MTNNNNTMPDASQTQESLTAILSDAGLSRTEIQIFVFLLKKDEGLRVSAIARGTRLNRTTLYGTLKTLAAKGLISSNERNGVLYFQSIQPHLLIDYLERAKDRLADDIKKAEMLIPEIARGRAERYQPNIQFFDGIAGIKQVYEDFIRNNKGKRVYGFTGAHALLNIMGYDWADRVVAKRAARGVKWLGIASEGEYAREMAKRDKKQMRETAFLPSGYSFDIELIAYDDKAAIISFAEDYPWAMIIADQKIAETVKTLFRFVNDSVSKKKTASA